MCLFVITWKDGTPLDATSVTKEDITEMCIQMGHLHPLGVLHYSMMELVALFFSTEEIQCATHRAIKGMELWDEAIAIRAVAPSVTHVNAYIMTMCEDHSQPQSPPSEEEGEPHSPHDNPHPNGETLHHLQVEFGKLTVHELHQLVEDLCQEITLCELNVPPRSPPPMPWGHPSGSGECQKRATRRSPFWVGEGGFPQDNHPHLLPLHDQMEDGFLRDHLHHPQLPTQPNPDMGHLINTLALGCMIGYP